MSLAEETNKLIQNFIAYSSNCQALTCDNDTQNYTCDGTRDNYLQELSYRVYWFGITYIK